MRILLAAIRPDADAVLEASARLAHEHAAALGVQTAMEGRAARPGELHDEAGAIGQLGLGAVEHALGEVAQPASAEALAGVLVFAAEHEPNLLESVMVPRRARPGLGDGVAGVVGHPVFGVVNREVAAVVLVLLTGPVGATGTGLAIDGLRTRENRDLSILAWRQNPDHFSSCTGVDLLGGCEPTSTSLPVWADYPLPGGIVKQR